MVPKDFRKPLCIAAGWFTLVVAVLWEIASIYSIGVYNCAWNFVGLHDIDSLNDIKTWNMLYITYFMGGCKSLTDALVLGFNFTPPSSPADNLQIWMWISTLLTVLWIPACVVLIVAVKNEVRGRAGAALYYPWISLTGILIIIDLGGTIYHLVDIYSTSTADDYAQFTDSKDWANLTLNAMSDGIHTWLPSLYVSLFFCRFIVFWVLNIFFLFNVYKASSAVSQYKSKYLQSSTMSDDKRKSWKTKFYQGPDPREFENQEVFFTRRPHLSNVVDIHQQEEMQEVNPSKNFPIAQIERQTAKRPSISSNAVSESLSNNSPVRYRVDEFGIPIEELNNSEPREISYNKNEGHLPRTPFQPGRVFDYTGRPVTKPEPYSEQRQDNTPPMASDAVEVPPELNRNRPFSYMAGDQPQLLKKPVSRSNSKAEYPVIPRPDYTIANRRRGSLEYIPHRFKMPSPNQPVQQENSFQYDSPSTSRSPSSPRRAAPVPPKKPQVYANVRAPLRSQPSVEEHTTTPQSSKSKQAVSRQQGH